MRQPLPSPLFVAALGAVFLPPHQAEAEIAVRGQQVGHVVVEGRQPPPPQQVLFDPSTPVTCGGHFAVTCADCPGARGRNFCNGICVWVAGSCEPRGATGRSWRLGMEQAWYFIRYWYPAFWVLFLVLMFLYALVYRSRVVENYDVFLTSRDQEFEVWRERSLGLDAVFAEGSTCLWAFFCTPVLAAKNYYVGQVVGFWPSCILLGLTMCSPFCFPISALLRAMLSGPLQRNLRYEPSFLRNFLLGLCCLPCEVGRESLEVDSETYREVRCPFRVDCTWSEPEKKPHHLTTDVASSVSGCIGRCKGDRRGWDYSSQGRRGWDDSSQGLYEPRLQDMESSGFIREP